MKVREATVADLDEMLRIYAAARRFMRENGNPTQWPESYPSRALLEKDIEKKQCYVCESGGCLCGAFVLAFGVEPTYENIEGGMWKNDAPYATIHRLGGDGSVSGVFAACLAFCLSRADTLRADTHRANLPMQHLLECAGFARCGTIYVSDGSARIAYQK